MDTSQISFHCATKGTPVPHILYPLFTNWYLGSFWYIFKKEIPIDEYHPEYVKTPISDFPISSICKIFAEEGEWTLEIHKFATVTI